MAAGSAHPRSESEDFSALKLSDAAESNGGQQLGLPSLSTPTLTSYFDLPAT